MSNPTLFEKLELKDEKTLLIQGLPSSIEKQFAKLSYAKNVTPLLKSKKIDFALIFAINQGQLNSILKDVFAALHDNTKMWIAYPKPASKIVSDLNRDCTWDILVNAGYESSTQLDIDHVWGIIRFVRNENALPNVEIVNNTNAANDIMLSAVNKSVDFEKTLVVPPVELEKIFTKHKKAKDFFTSLPVDNQKEYVSWIEQAKRSDTKQRRLDAVVEKLNAGKTKPTEK
jgi:Bacteriocin-protection, YdeI or OmpD-Associated